MGDGSTPAVPAGNDQPLSEIVDQLRLEMSKYQHFIEREFSELKRQHSEQITAIKDNISEMQRQHAFEINHVIQHYEEETRHIRDDFAELRHIVGEQPLDVVELSDIVHELHDKNTPDDNHNSPKELKSGEHDII